jgi:HEAT repeat protein
MVALFLVLGLAQPASADLLLGAIDVVLDPMTVTAADLTEDHALSVARDPNARRYLRVRAVGALAIFGSARARAALREFARHDLDVEVRIQASVSLARGFGVDAPGETTAFLLQVADGAPPALARVIRHEVRRLQPAR